MNLADSRDLEPPRRVRCVQTRRIPGVGWIEIGISIVIVLASVLAWRSGSLATAALLADMVTFVAVLTTLLAPEAGLVLLSVATASSLIVDPTGRGFTVYLLVCALVAFTRRANWISAALTTCLVGLATVLSVWRFTDGEEVAGAVAATVLFAGLGWTLGLGFREIQRSAESRASRRHRQQLHALATTLHGEPTRNLAVAVMQLESIKAESAFWTPDLEQVLQRIRSTNNYLREVTAKIDDQPALAAATPSVPAALTRGIKDLRLAGFKVVTEPEQIHTGLWDQLGATDTAASSIMTEALHNAAKHGSPAHPCHITLTASDGGLQVIITNHIASTSPHGGSGMGLPTMQQHAALVGGEVRSVPNGDIWSCTITLPVTAQLETR